MMTAKYKKGTTIAQIVSDGWARGLPVHQVVSELLAQHYEYPTELATPLDQLVSECYSLHNKLYEADSRVGMI